MQEDTLLKRLIAQHGTTNWSLIAKFVPGRSGKSCEYYSVSDVCANCCAVLRAGTNSMFTLRAGRLRFYNQLQPCLKKEPFSAKEDAYIIQVSPSCIRPPDKVFSTLCAHISIRLAIQWVFLGVLATCLVGIKVLAVVPSLLHSDFPPHAVAIFSSLVVLRLSCS